MVSIKYNTFEKYLNTVKYKYFCIWSHACLEIILTCTAPLLYHVFYFTCIYRVLSCNVVQHPFTSITFQCMSSIYNLLQLQIINILISYLILSKYAAFGFLIDFVHDRFYHCPWSGVFNWYIQLCYSVVCRATPHGTYIYLGLL